MKLLEKLKSKTEQASSTLTKVLGMMSEDRRFKNHLVAESLRMDLELDKQLGLAKENLKASIQRQGRMWRAEKQVNENLNRL